MQPAEKPKSSFASKYADGIASEGAEAVAEVVFEKITEGACDLLSTLAERACELLD